MDERAALPQSTLVVLLGASEWPHWADLNQELSERKTGNAKTFAASADKVKEYFLDRHRFNLPESNLLNLFNAKEDPAGLLRSLGRWLDERIASNNQADSPATQLVIYYVGHGGFVDDDFYLVIHNSDESNKIASSLRPKSLAEIIKEKAIGLRCFLIIDCCFAGALVSAFEGTPINGVSLLCSSASTETSQATLGDTYTMFSGMLLQVLENGNRDGPRWFSLRSLGTEIRKGIDFKYRENGVKPIVRSPVQYDCDIADLPMFPNAGRQPLKEREWFAEKSDLAQCYVIESATEEQLPQNEALRIIVQNALVKYEERLNNMIGKCMVTTPIGVNIDRVMASPDGIENAINALCHAEIAVFDVTNYEPVVMLLLGIRSVVRRGVTIASAGGEYVVGDPIQYPFSIKEVNFVSHSRKQAKTYNPIDLIGTKMIAGFEQLRYLPDYLDLPVYDAIRTLPPERDQRVPKPCNEQVLMLCPFSRSYTDNNWEKHLKPYLTARLPKTQSGESPPILRTLDLKSPRLVSQSLYEEMRLTQMCVVDWTDWRPTVFFELGVRLAAVDINPVCIIETMQKQLIEFGDFNEGLRELRNQLSIVQEINKDAKMLNLTSYDIERLRYSAYQCRRMLELFDPFEYRAPIHERIDRNDLEVYEDIVNYHLQLIQDGNDSIARKGLPPSFIYQVVSEHIDVSMEVSALPVHSELMREADLMSDPQIDSTGRSPVLYPNNEALTGRANKGALERRLAAWYYINNRLKDQLQKDSMLRKEFKVLGNLLARALLRSDKEMAQQIRQHIKSLEEIREQEDQQ